MIDKKTLRSWPVLELQAQRKKRVAMIERMCGSHYPNLVGGEIGQIDKELERRNPRTVHYTVDMDECASKFYFVADNGKKTRVHPRKPQGGTRYPQDLTSDEIDWWMRREGITHIVADTEDDETSPECIKRGKHTRAAFIKWWRLLEQDD